MKALVVFYSQSLIFYREHAPYEASGQGSVKDLNQHI
jgi:hypothetical protein